MTTRRKTPKRRGDTTMRRMEGDTMTTRNDTQGAGRWGIDTMTTRSWGTTTRNMSHLPIPRSLDTYNTSYYL